MIDASESSGARVAALIDELRAMEARLDPAAYRKHQIKADAITVLALLPPVLWYEWYARYPLLMFAAMLVGLGLNRVPPALTRWRLRREHDRLFARYQKTVSLLEEEAG